MRNIQRPVRWLAAGSAAFALLAPVVAQAPRERSLRDAEARQLARCEAIAPGQGDSGLIFNPQGLRTVYARSHCFQELAIQLGEPTLCTLAVERKSLLFDGSGISPAACRRLVGERLERDRAEALGLKRQSVTSLALQMNGNGRDLDVLVGTSGGSALTYRLLVSLVAPREAVLLDIQQPLAGAGTRLQHLLRASVLDDALGGETRFRVQAELRLEPRDLDQVRLHKQLAPLAPTDRTLTCQKTGSLLRCGSDS